MDTSNTPSQSPVVQSQSPGPSAIPSVAPVMSSQSPKGSSNTGMILAVIFVVLMVVGVGAYAFMSKENSSPSINTTTNISAQTLVSPTVSNAQPVQVGSDLSKGNSDADLQQDAQSLDNSVKGADSQINSVDQGLNDQPANLGQ